jgi:hypothetical protein
MLYLRFWLRKLIFDLRSLLRKINVGFEVLAAENFFLDINLSLRKINIGYHYVYVYKVCHLIVL